MMESLRSTGGGVRKPATPKVASLYIHKAFDTILLDTGVKLVGFPQRVAGRREDASLE